MNSLAIFKSDIYTFLKRCQSNNICQMWKVNLWILGTIWIFFKDCAYFLKGFVIRFKTDYYITIYNNWYKLSYYTFLKKRISTIIYGGIKNLEFYSLFVIYIYIIRIANRNLWPICCPNYRKHATKYTFTI